MSSNDPLAELLGGFLGGGTQGGGGNLADLLGALTQGGSAAGQAGGMPQEGGLADILGQMSQAASEPQVGGGQPQAGGELGQILGSLLGGGTPQSQGSPIDMQQGAGGLGDVMGALLGGGMQGSAPSMGAPASASQGAVGIGDILGAVMGGGSTGIGASPLLAPIANLLSEKSGLPPAIAQAVVAFVLAKLMSGSGGRASTSRMGLAEEELGMQDLLQRASSGQHLDKRTLAATGLPEELAQHTGMDVNTANQSLQQALKLLGPALMSDRGAAQ